MTCRLDYDTFYCTYNQWSHSLWCVCECVCVCKGEVYWTRVCASVSLRNAAFYGVYGSSSHILWYTCHAPIRDPTTQSAIKPFTRAPHGDSVWGLHPIDICENGPETCSLTPVCALPNRPRVTRIDLQLAMDFLSLAAFSADVIQLGRLSWEDCPVVCWSMPQTSNMEMVGGYVVIYSVSVSGAPVGVILFRRQMLHRQLRLDNDVYECVWCRMDGVVGGSILLFVIMYVC